MDEFPRVICRRRSISRFQEVRSERSENRRIEREALDPSRGKKLICSCVLVTQSTGEPNPSEPDLDLEVGPVVLRGDRS
jgi:hypothetical protein